MKHILVRLVRSSKINASLAQLVEQLPFKETVAGSSPAGGTTQQEAFIFASLPDLYDGGGDGGSCGVDSAINFPFCYVSRRWFSSSIWSDL